MIVTLKKIMYLINTENAPVHYYTYEGGGYGFLIYLQTISEDQQKKFYHLPVCDQREYVSDSAEIFIPRISADYLGQIYKNCASHDFPYTVSKIKKLVSVSSDDECVAVALYMLLHEIGHWVDFVRCGMKPYQYTIQDADEARKVHNYGNLIQMEIRNKRALTEKDHEKLEDFIQKYYNVPIEKRANQYADLHYVDAYNTLKENGMVNAD